MEGLDFSGQQVGPYALTKRIGLGASSGVYCAVDVTSGRHPAFAVKCLSKRKLSPRRWHQLVSEIISHDAVTGCTHVLPLWDIIEEDAYFFLVLGLCETDMYRAIWEDKVYWRNDALIRRAFVDVLDGVHTCHRRGVFHRDLKPANIMCKADGTGVQIGDFGLATCQDPCRSGACGSPNYMSPECWTSNEKKPYSGSQNDIWSLGVILYNMVTNRYPWQVALPSDREFVAFLDNEDHLFYTSPISGQLNDLLKWILHPIPSKRPSIPVIRQTVLEMDTFYKWRGLRPGIAFPRTQRTLVPILEKKATTCFRPAYRKPGVLKQVQSERQE